MIENIQCFIEQHKLIPDEATIVVGFSGGPDSLFLLHFLAQLRHTKRLKLIAAHLDHEWRTDSHDEAATCRSQADSLEISFISARMSELAVDKKSSGSQEELGRRARRFFLEKVRREHKADSIALAHHLDDQEETFFIRLIRGTTITGLTSMKPRDGHYIRPLLETQKIEIVAYLEENGISYITDPSNMSETYLRTRIRKNVIPALRHCDKRFDKNFQRTLHNLQETESYLAHITQETFFRVAQLQQSTWHLELASFFALHSFMQHRILMHWLIANAVPLYQLNAFLAKLCAFCTNLAIKSMLCIQHGQL